LPTLLGDRLEVLVIKQFGAVGAARFNIAVDTLEERRKAPAKVHAHTARVTDLENASQLGFMIAFIPEQGMLESECGRVFRFGINLCHRTAFRGIKRDHPAWFLLTGVLGCSEANAELPREIRVALLGRGLRQCGDALTLNRCVCRIAFSSSPE